MIPFKPEGIFSGDFDENELRYAGGLIEEEAQLFDVLQDMTHNREVETGWRKWEMAAVIFHRVHNRRDFAAADRFDRAMAEFQRSEFRAEPQLRYPLKNGAVARADLDDPVVGQSRTKGDDILRRLSE